MLTLPLLRPVFQGRLFTCLTLILLASLGLSACGGGGGGSSASSSKSLSGTVMSATQPIANATILLYSVSATAGAAPQQVGHATSSSNGSWHITYSNHAFTAGQLTYLVALGGDSGAGDNPNSALMSAAVADEKGYLPAKLVVNELTTIATTSQLQHDISMVDCSTIAHTSITTTGQSCPSIAGAMGLSARASTIGNLVNLTTGADSDFLTGNATASTAIDATQQDLNFEANALAACVGTTGGSSGDGSACGNLFALFSPAPTNTLTAALALAQQADNSTVVSGLFNLSPPASFTPATSSAPASWTVGGSEFAYAINFNSSNLSAYRVDASSGALTQITGSPFATGTHPLAVTVSPNGAFVYVANNDSSDVSAYSIDPATGTLTAMAGSPFALESTVAQPYAITASPNGAFVYVADFGSEQISAYRIDSVTGVPTAISGSPFATDGGPTSVTVSPDNAFAYVTNHIYNTVTGYAINAETGALTAIGGSPSATGSYPFAASLSPNGKFAYVANMLGNTLSAYGINANTGALTEMTGSPFATGAAPQSVAVSVDGAFVYVVNQNDSTLSAFAIDAGTGALTAISGSPFATGTHPQAVMVSPNGAFAYVANKGGNNISAYDIDASSGALTAITGSPFSAGTVPYAVAMTP